MLGKLNKGMLVLLLALGLTAFGGLRTGAATDSRTQTLEVVKYGLTPGATGFEASQTTNDGQKINNLPTDNLGKELKPMAGIHYKVQEIEPVGSPSQMANVNPSASSYVKVGSEIDLVTDANGVASLDLPYGYYLLSEVANADAGLSHPAQPVVISLPVYNEQGSSLLDTVYVYPKSSVDPKESEATPPSSSDKPAATSDKAADGPQYGPWQKLLKSGVLPDTGVASSLMMMLTGFIILLVLFILMKKRRKENEKDQA